MKRSEAACKIAGDKFFMLLKQRLYLYLSFGTWGIIYFPTTCNLSNFYEESLVDCFNRYSNIMGGIVCPVYVSVKKHQNRPTGFA